MAVIISAIIDQKASVLQMKWNDGFRGSSPLSLPTLGAGKTSKEESMKIAGTGDHRYNSLFGKMWQMVEKMDLQGQYAHNFNFQQFSLLFQRASNKYMIMNSALHCKKTVI